MPDEGENFDAELDAILSGGEAAAQPTAPIAQPTETAKEALRAGGRDWSSPTDLGKAYDALLKDYSKTKNEGKANEKWVNWGKAVDKHPELRSDLEQRIDAFHKRGLAAQNAGQSSGVASPELQEKISRLENYVAKNEVNAEIASLKAKYSPDKGLMSTTLAKAAEFAERGIDIPLEDVYRIVSYDAKAMQERAAGERDGAGKFAAKKAANVGGSSAATVAPGAKSVNQLSNEEYDRALSEELHKFGITG